MMKVLIGTPIHVSKDYAIERWLKNVAELISVTPADLFMVDNSPGTEYAERIKGRCAKCGLKNYEIDHLEIDEKLGVDMRIEVSQETIRQYVLSRDYDAWFSWECDQILPTNALDKLIRIMKMGNYMMVVHNSWARWDPTILNTNMGCTLTSRQCLEKIWFLPAKNGKISLDPSDSYDVNDPMFKKRVLKSGGNYIDVYGVIEPILHLNK